MTTKTTELVIPAADLRILIVRVRGTAPYVQNKFSEKAKAEMRAKMEAGSTAKTRKVREAKNFTAAYEAAQHRSTEGWVGIPATAFRHAMVDACRLVGFHMTSAKQAVFVEADGYDADDGTPLIKFVIGEPAPRESMVRNATGVSDIRVRPWWSPGWEADVRIKFDAGMFSATDVINLLSRAGQQVGIGEGRPFSKKSHGMGWGIFEIVTSDEDAA